jgi:hypothetical protein
MVRTLFLVTAMIAAQASPVAAQPVRSAFAGPPTRMLTIGNKHLFALQPKPSADTLALVLEKLARWKPTIITHEGISGEQCALLMAQGPRNPDRYSQYCYDAGPAQKAAGVDLPAAMIAIDALFKDWPENPTASQRRRLALLFLAVDDRYSARVQWLQLPVSERIAGDGIIDALLPILNRTSDALDESDDIGVALAVRLGLQRIYPVDDHSADAAMTPYWGGIGPVVDRVWGVPNAPALVQFETRSRAIGDAQAMLDFYRLMNGRTLQQTLARESQGRLIRDAVPPHYGRMHAAWWEARNMRMVANVREATVGHPGARVLNLVGAGHKPWYDAYLAMLADVQIEDAQAVLK